MVHFIRIIITDQIWWPIFKQKTVSKVVTPRVGGCLWYFKYFQIPWWGMIGMGSRNSSIWKWPWAWAYPITTAWLCLAKNNIKQLIYPRRTGRRSPCSHHLRFCHGFNTSLIQIHADDLHFSIIFTSGSIMLIFFPLCTMYIYVQSIPSLQKDLNLPPPPTNTYKTQDPGEPEIYAKNPSTTSWGSVENSGRFTRKNINSGQTSGSVRIILWACWMHFVFLSNCPILEAPIFTSPFRLFKFHPFLGIQIYGKPHRWRWDVNPLIF